MKEIIIDNQKYFAYSEEEIKMFNKHTEDFYKFQETNIAVKIKNEYPKIISFREIGNNNLFVLSNKGYIDYMTPSTYYSLNEMLYGCSSVEDGYVEIYEIAVSENETYKLGDDVAYVGGLHNFIIDNFYLRNDDVLLARSKDETMVEDVMTIEKVLTPIFITEDSIEIFNKDQYVYGVCMKANWQTSEYSVSHLSRAKNNEYSSSFNTNTWKFFSTKELRDTYREENIPKYSKKEILDAMLYSKHKNNGDESSIMSEIKFKEKLNIK